MEPNRGFVLHSLDWAGKTCVTVDGRYGMTGTKDILRAIADGKGPDCWLPALGHVAWDAGQLEEEIHALAWLPVELTTDMIFPGPNEDVWRMGFRTAGVDPMRISKIGGQA